jgi:predicted outer membrane repeat protein
MKTKLFSTFLIIMTFIAVSAQISPVLGEAAAPQVVIGGGTEASCQTEDAANDFSNAVAGGGVIDFDCGSDPVTIIVNTNATDQQVTVNGNGLIHLSGEDLRQIFLVSGSGNLILNDLTLEDGNTGQGGAIFIDSQASVTIRRSFLVGNNAANAGGGVYNKGTLVIEDSTLGSNIAGTNGGGIFNDGGSVTILKSYLISNQSNNGGAVYTANGQLTIEQSAVRSSFITNEGGGIYAAGDTAISNSTFSNNRAAKGGAIFGAGNVTILNVTFNENRADIAGAIWRDLSSTITVQNSILAGSLDSGGNSPNLNCDGPTLTSLGHNIISDNTCVPNPSIVGDLLGTNPLLGVWQISPLRAYIPDADSPAVDYGLDCPPVDQRGYPRPIGAACDVGSIERGELVFLPLSLR